VVKWFVTQERKVAERNSAKVLRIACITSWELPLITSSVAIIFWYGHLTSKSQAQNLSRLTMGSHAMFMYHKLWKLRRPREPVVSAKWRVERGVHRPRAMRIPFTALPLIYFAITYM